MKKKNNIILKIQMLLGQIIASEERPLLNMSVYISEQLGLNYTYLSNIFSEQHGITIEHFYIGLKIEKAKELLVETEDAIQDIGARLHYCSKAHFSTQFKVVTGCSPSVYRQEQKEMTA